MSGVEPGDEGSAPEPQVLATLEHEGSNVEFIETDPGFILVTSRSNAGQPNVLADPELRELDAVQLYERLSGKAAPGALLDAHERGLALPDSADSADSADPTEEADGVGVAMLPLTASEFASQDCAGMQFCATNQTANHEWGTYKVHFATGFVNPVSGEVRLQVRHRRVRKWRNYSSTLVPQGAVLHWNYRSPRPLVNFRLKVAVYDVDPGDLYHFSMDFHDPSASSGLDAPPATP